MPTIEELLDRAEEAIKRSKAVDLWRPSDARVNAEELISEVLGREVTSDDLEHELTPQKRKRLSSFVQRRVNGEPVAMIIGYTEFKGMKLIVRKGVFVPRTSSELLAEEAIKKLRTRPKPNAVDVATGAGPVALAIAKQVSKAQVWGLDISPKPLSVARENARLLRLRNTNFLKSDMLHSLSNSLKRSIDVFTIHPPYVAPHAIRELPDEIRHFEPPESLSDRSHDGLGLVRRLLDEAPAWLRRGGWLMVEVSPDLSRKVRGMLQRAGFERVKSNRDSLGATRVVIGQLKTP